jgi:hypothetical protein
MGFQEGNIAGWLLSGVGLTTGKRCATPAAAGRGRNFGGLLHSENLGMPRPDIFASPAAEFCPRVPPT